MPRRPVDWYWRERVYTIVANDPKRGPKSIAAELEREARELGRTDWPSERTVGRLKERFFKEKSPEERMEYEYAYWPEAMERGLLPWEAGQALLELRQYLGYLGDVRPTTALAKWYWRFRLAAPTAPVGLLCWCAAGMAWREADPGTSSALMDEVERFLQVIEGWEQLAKTGSAGLLLCVPGLRDLVIETIAGQAFGQQLDTFRIAFGRLPEHLLKLADTLLAAVPEQQRQNPLAAIRIMANIDDNPPLAAQVASLLQELLVPSELRLIASPLPGRRAYRKDEDDGQEAGE